MTDDEKFARVDMRRINEASLVFHDIEVQVNHLFKELAIRLDTKAKDLMKTEKKLEKKAKIMDAAALVAEVNLLNHQKQEIQEELKIDRQRLEKAYVDARSVMNRKITEVIETIAIKEGYSAVFEVSALVSDERDDITDDVIRQMNDIVTSYKIDY
ncbi:OmpH family outer membrane protein [Thiothrix lacustris]|uniref:OmpH family outer membrane protein n=1 Tax=Thiothrix lacustris TaxID=525917 RepID=UPI0027E4DEC9|nr:OmpH family outer membrane protein [Thiothrix lacustris]WMP17083.1 OmpH family outer membrane protein [Thiothrix lacustris]